MTRSLESLVAKVLFTATLKNTLTDAPGNATAPQVAQGHNYAPATALGSGTTAYKADLVWTSYSRDIASGANLDIDLYDLGSLDIGAGAGKDALGQTWTAAEIVGLYVKSSKDSTGALYVGGEGSSAAWNSFLNASDTAKLGPIYKDGVFLLFNPADPALLVADGSNHLLRLSASGGDVTVDLAILARSA